MNVDTIITFVTLGAAMLLFMSDRLRLDVVALLALLALLLTGVLTPDEALAGFSSQVVIMIAGLFVIGAGLTETGVADWLGQRLGKIAGHDESQLIIWVMLATSLLSAFMSSTGTVAILLPVVGTLAHRRGIPPGHVFLPMAFAAHLGSMLTLISTPPNLIVSDALKAAGREPFRFFSFFPVGIVILVVGVAFMVLWGRRRLSNGEAPGERPAARTWTVQDLAHEYGLDRSLHTLRVRPGSRLAGTMLGDANLRAVHHVNVVGIESPDGNEIRPVLPRTEFAQGDLIRVQGERENVEAMAREWDLDLVSSDGEFVLPREDTLAEVVIPRRSGLAGRTLRQARFRDKYRATVLAVRRASGSVAAVGPATPALLDFHLRSGDTLLLKGRHKHLRNLRDERRDFILVAEPDLRPDSFVSPRRAAAALLITLGMLVVMAFGFLPNVVAVLVAAIAMVLTRCVRPVDAYRSMNWESVVLIAAMLPMATALEKTGGTRLLVSTIEARFLGAPPAVILAAIMVLTAVIGLVISNTATAVLVAPVAVRVAEALGIAPEPMLMGVAVAASAAFATPVSSPVNTIVMGPGGYRFADFARVGIPLLLLVLAVGLVVIPIVFPF